jgi:DNA-binding MarR family transcriptional regulator
LKIDETSARDALAELENIDILRTVGDRVSATPSGVALFQRVRDRIRPITERLYAGLSNEDLAVAHRVLATILERANAILMDWSSVAA